MTHGKTSTKPSPSEAHDHLVHFLETLFVNKMLGPVVREATKGNGYELHDLLSYIDTLISEPSPAQLTRLTETATQLVAYYRRLELEDQCHGCDPTTWDSPLCSLCGVEPLYHNGGNHGTWSHDSDECTAHFIRESFYRRFPTIDQTKPPTPPTIGVQNDP